LIEKKTGKMTKRNLTKGTSIKPRPLGVIRDITEHVKYETRLLALHTHALQLSSAKEIGTIVKYTLDAMEFTLGFEHAYFLLVENDSLQIKGSIGGPAAYSAQPLDGRGVTVKAANIKTTLRISDTRKEPAFVDPKGYDWTGPPSVLSELVVPVLIDAEAVAVLCVDSTRPDDFTDDDQRLLETLTIHVGSALGRLRHEEELETVARFSSENPSPVFRLNGNGTILYANQASNALLQKWGCKVGGICPKFWQDLVTELLTHQTSKTVDVDLGERASVIYLVPVVSAGYVNAYGRDITERKRMDEMLRESEEKYRGLVENSLNFIGILQDGILKYVNRTAVERFGWTYYELVSPSFDPIEKVVAERFRGLIKENVGKRLREEDAPPYEISLTTRDGSEIPVIVRAAKIVYQGRPAVEFTFSDITERKRMEEELSRSSQFLGSVIENAYVWLNVLDNEQNVLVWNKAAEVMSGYSREEVVGHGKIWEWLYPDQEYRKQITETVTDVLQSGRTDVDVETKIKRKDGQTRIISWNERALTDQDGKVIGTIAIGHDITELKQMQHELQRYSKHLQESEEKLRALHQHALQLSSASNINRIIEHTLDAMEFALGFDVADFYLLEGDFLRVKGTRGNPLGLSEEHIDGRGLVARAARSKATVRVSDTSKESDYVDRKGCDWKTAPTMFSELAVPVIVHGETTAVLNVENVRLGAFSDEDQRLLETLAAHVGSEMQRLKHGQELETYSKHLEELVEERTKKLRAAERLAAVGETAAMVGQDLRNPLQGIAGALYLLKQESLTARERNEMLQLIQDNVEYSDAIVRDLSDYSAEIQLKLVETTLKSITRGAMRAVKVPEKVTVQDLSEDYPAIRVDPDKMRRVFINLIENAIGAMPQGGTLTISSKQSNGDVEIALSDTGSGMPKKVIENLWKPLQTTKAKGLGLGLAICKRITDAHGGTINVKSKTGEGTTITIRLPIKPDAVEVKQR